MYFIKKHQLEETDNTKKRRKTEGKKKTLLSLFASSCNIGYSGMLSSHQNKSSQTRKLGYFCFCHNFGLRICIIEKKQES